MLPYNSIQEAAGHLSRNLTYIETIWFNYSSDKSDFFLYNHSIILVFLVFSFGFISVVFFQRFASLDKYKIQPNVCLSTAEIFNCYKSGTLAYLFVILPLELAAYPVIKMVGIRTGLTLPSGWEMMAQISIYLIVEDYMSYWIHRGLHCGWVYKRFHKVHHEYTAPVAIAAAYNHWTDTVVLGIPTLVGPAMVPGHMLTLWLWFSIRQLETLGTHSGYDFPWDITKYIPFYGGAKFHNYHHYVGGQSHSNFSAIFTYCDYIYGTDKGYQYHKKVLGKMQEREAGERGAE
ncbi:Methylsterol monooxygenase 1-2 [Linum grandiflorum]